MDQPQQPRPPQKDDVLEVPIQTLAFGGKGLARLDDFVVFVTGAVPGDVVRVSVTKAKKRYAEARVLELIKPSPDRLEPRCSSFGTCGGCVWQNIDYGVQLAYKAQQVRESLEHLGRLSGFELRPILGMTDPWRYRNRVDFSIGISAAGAVVGFRPPGRWDTVLPLSECHLLPDEMEGIRATVESWLREKGLPGWNPREGEGFARHLVVRSAQLGSELLVNLVTGPSDLPEFKGFVERLRSAHPGIVGIAHAVNAGRAELSAGLESRTLWGRPYLLEKLAGITLRVSLDAFFQTNTIMAQVLYGLVADEALGPPPKEGRAESGVRPAAARTDSPVVWDLYSGVGSIGLSLAGRAAEVLGIEAIPAAIRDAEENARLNGIEQRSVRGR